MEKGYLKKNCVLGPGVEDGQQGQEVTPKSVGPEVFERLVFNGAVSETPIKKAKAAKG